MFVLGELCEWPLLVAQTVPPMRTSARAETGPTMSQNVAELSVGEGSFRYILQNVTYADPSAYYSRFVYALDRCL